MISQCVVKWLTSVAVARAAFSILQRLDVMIGDFVDEFCLEELPEKVVYTVM